MFKLPYTFLLIVILTRQLTKSYPLKEPSSWKHYPCSVSCGGGYKKIEKLCKQSNGCYDEESHIKIIECNVEPCKLDGK